MSRYLQFIFESLTKCCPSQFLHCMISQKFSRNAKSWQNPHHFQVVKSESKNGFADNFVDITGPPPKPKPRKAKSNKTSTFQSHVMENWETHSPVHGNSTLSPPEIEEKSKSAQKRPSFKSHAQVPTGDLIDF